MLEFAIGSLSLSIVHAIIPNHWVPIITIGQAEGWSFRETIGVTALTGLAHSFGTIAMGLLLGAIGMQMADQFEHFSHWIAPAVIIALGLYYIFFRGFHFHHHMPQSVVNKSKTAIIIALALSMFLSPCLEMETYFVYAGKESWAAILLIASIFLVATTITMILLVMLGFYGVERIQVPFLQKHEKKITGTVLVLIGLYAIFFSH